MELRRALMVYEQDPRPDTLNSGQLMQSEEAQHLASELPDTRLGNLLAGSYVPKKAKGDLVLESPSSVLMWEVLPAREIKRERRLT